MLKIRCLVSLGLLSSLVACSTSPDSGTVLGSPVFGTMGIRADWVRQFGTVGDQYANSVCVDLNKDIYVTGYTSDTLPGQVSLGGGDVFIRKYRSGGSVLWEKQFGTPNADFSAFVTTDLDGNVYVAGTTEGTFPEQRKMGLEDAFIQKYSSAGVLLWTRQFGTISKDGVSAIVSDNNQDIYVAGYTLDAFPGETNLGLGDIVVRKYKSNGTLLWTKQFGTTGYDKATGLSTDAANNLYVAGTIGGKLPGQPSPGGLDSFIRMYKPDGTELWTRVIGTSGQEFASTVTTDVSGNVYVAGSIAGAFPGQTPMGSYDVFIQKYTDTGNLIFTRQFGTPKDDRIESITADELDYLYVVGTTEGVLPGQTSLGEVDLFAQKYRPNGTAIWTSQFGTSGFDMIGSVAVNTSNGSFYAVGSIYGTLSGETSFGNWDAFIQKWLP
ncbi:MAG: SBBP repeat-containing protein [Deinococcaceae bacterium]